MTKADLIEELSNVASLTKKQTEANVDPGTRAAAGSRHGA